MRDQEPQPRLSINDPWILSSLIQKAIRRGDNELATESWTILNAIDAKRAWRRLMLIAFEDIGVADLNAVIEVTTISSSKRPNKASGLHLVQLLAKARKDRSADYLFCSCIRHPSSELQRLRAEQASDQERLKIVSGDGYDLESRALAAIVLLQRSKGGRGFGWTRMGIVRAVVERFTEDGALRVAVETAFRKSGEPFLLTLPLLAEYVRVQAHVRSKAVGVPHTKYVDCVPMYALDKHTRVGRAAIREFVADKNDVRRCLKHHVSGESVKPAAYMAAYYADATPISNRFVWSDSDRLEIRGREADMYSAGVSLDGVAPVLEVFRQNLVNLDEIRARLFRKRFGGGDL